MYKVHYYPRVDYFFIVLRRLRQFSTLPKQNARRRGNSRPHPPFVLLFSSPSRTIHVFINTTRPFRYLSTMKKAYLATNGSTIQNVIHLYACTIKYCTRFYLWSHFRRAPIQPHRHTATHNVRLSRRAEKLIIKGSFYVWQGPKVHDKSFSRFSGGRLFGIERK